MKRTDSKIAWPDCACEIVVGCKLSEIEAWRWDRTGWLDIERTSLLQGSAVLPHSCKGAQFLPGNKSIILPCPSTAAQVMTASGRTNKEPSAVSNSCSGFGVPENDPKNAATHRDNSGCPRCLVESWSWLEASRLWRKWKCSQQETRPRPD
jgi:hypothetical protein